MTQPPGLRAQLEEGMHPRWRKVDADLIDPLLAAVSARTSDPSPPPAEVARILAAEVAQTSKAIAELHDRHQAFAQRHSVMKGDTEVRANILAYATELGAGPRQLRGDRRAFRRWFGYDAMVARFQRRQGDLLRKLAFLFGRLGLVTGRALEYTDAPEGVWHALDLGTLASPWLDPEEEPRVGAAALRGLAAAIRGLPPGLRTHALDVDQVQTIRRVALDPQRDIWMQCEACALLQAIDPESFDQVARVRLQQHPPDRDDLFVRRRLVPMVAARPALHDLLDTLMRDPSDYVRQGLAECLPRLAPKQALPLVETLIRNESAVPVRASALLQITPLAASDEPSCRLAALLTTAMAAETDPYVLRVAIQVAAETHAALPETKGLAWRDELLPALRRIHQGHPLLAARRWAAQARERIWCHAAPERRDLLQRIREAAQQTPPGTSVLLHDEDVAVLDDETLGRVLSVAAQEDFGFDVVRRRNGIRLIRGHRFGFRFWRWLHELRHPSPDKRQAFRHTIGRIFEGPLRAPSGLLSEMSQTKVPGEPLTLALEGGWRPFLPLVDDVLSFLEEQAPDQPLVLVTSEGVTRLHSPRSPVQRARAHWALTRRFDVYARWRNAEDPSAYIAGLRRLGITCEFTPAEGEELEPHAAQCFGDAKLPALALASPEMGARVREYVYSVYGNSLGQLLLFLAAATAFLVGRHVYANQVFFRSRRRIPLVIGGWGTRGKSGTERIKAALLNAQGHRLVSKTTGCEAMYLYADTFGKLHELFLFRPYDKATIWEQVHMVNLAARLRAHIFLWECMGLNPEYIEVLQRQWMKDDISTIVNTYPDHEDVQGPAGVNIPEVMRSFLSKGGHMLTSEQHMTPILEAEARRLPCRFDRIGWLEPGLLTADILDRFPYAEHPNNIALVAEMGVQLGIPYDVALKEMADRVVPDLGVLKAYPVARLAGRRLQFVNGFSANERFGALGNWRRMGFDQHDPCEEPGQWITVVVNNRADRVTRSRVFASLVVEDIAVDRLFLIGSNLEGLLGYIREAREQLVTSLSLFPEDGPEPAVVLRQIAHRWRFPTSPSELQQALDAIQGDGDLGRWRESYEQAYQEYQILAAALDDETDHSRQDASMRAQLRVWFERKVVVIHDFHATGEQIIDRICRETPPGYLNRILGLQNIKGTGLDFVYRWQAWDLCEQACRQLTDRKPKVAREGAAALVAFKEYGSLCEEAVRQAVKEAGKRHGRRDPAFQAQLDLVEENLEVGLRKLESTSEALSPDAGWVARCWDWALRTLEDVLDAGDAIRRRKRADQIYRDMAAERISPALAAMEVQRLNKRQKGGWLIQSFEEWKARRRGRGRPT